MTQNAIQTRTTNKFGDVKPTPNLEETLRGSSYFFNSSSSLTYAINLLKNNSIPYFTITGEEGYYFFWKTNEGRLCSRHFDIILNNTYIKNEFGPLYKSYQDFIASSYVNSDKYYLSS